MKLKFIPFALLSVLLAAGSTACHRKKRDPGQAPHAPDGNAPFTSKAPIPVIKPAPHPLSSAPHGDVSLRIEELTHGHTRLVWNETLPGAEADPNSVGNEQTLGGIDTRDGKGVRSILSKTDNYTRPLLSVDGETILFSSFDIIRKGNDKETVWSTYRTDWAGSTPVAIADGLVLSVWREPSTHIEWVYCGRRMRGKRSRGTVREVWRFELENPAHQEMVYDDSPVSGSDNVQLSRDGTRACALLPWPKGGIIKLNDKPPTGVNFTNGCWPSMAPDDSRISWVFRGDHRSAVFFAEDGKNSWKVDFNPPFGLAGEGYHPRWSNHARFMTITGPYQSKGDGDMALHGKQNRPEVFLGRFNGDATKMEGWVQVTQNGTAKGYPDAWIVGGATANLAQSAQPLSGSVAPPGKTWPLKRDGLVFLWSDRSASNSWKGSDGRTRSVDLEGHGAARYGRFDELMFDGGQFTPEEDEQAAILAGLNQAPEISFEALICLDSRASSRGWIARFPGFAAGLQDKTLLIFAAGQRPQQVTLASARSMVHLVIIRRASSLEVWIDGTKAPMSETHESPPDGLSVLAFGGNASGFGLKGISLFSRALAPEEIAANAESQFNTLSSATAAPKRLQLAGKLVEISHVPTIESIEPYTGALITAIYEVEKVAGGEFTDKRILVKHWALLNKKPVAGFPREIGKSYNLLVEQEPDHPELRGERVVDDTTAFDLTPWIDVSPLAMKP